MADHFLPDAVARIGNRKFWKRGHVRAYLARVSGDPPPAPQPDDDHLVGSLELRLILGGVSDMWLHRHTRRSTPAAPTAAPPSAA
jgi:hypothetical protein